MGDAQKYSHDLDMVFQEMKDKEELQEQAITDEVIGFVGKLIERKRVQRLFEALTFEERRAYVRHHVRRKFPDWKNSN